MPVWAPLTFAPRILGISGRVSTCLVLGRRVELGARAKQLGGWGLVRNRCREQAAMLAGLLGCCGCALVRIAAAHVETLSCEVRRSVMHGSQGWLP